MQHRLPGDSGNSVETESKTDGIYAADQRQNRGFACPPDADVQEGPSWLKGNTMDSPARMLKVSPAVSRGTSEADGVDHGTARLHIEVWPGIPGKRDHKGGSSSDIAEIPSAQAKSKSGSEASPQRRSGRMDDIYLPFQTSVIDRQSRGGRRSCFGFGDSKPRHGDSTRVLDRTGTRTHISNIDRERRDTRKFCDNGLTGSGSSTIYVEARNGGAEGVRIEDGIRSGARVFDSSTSNTTCDSKELGVSKRPIMVDPSPSKTRGLWESSSSQCGVTGPTMGSSDAEAPASCRMEGLRDGNGRTNKVTRVDDEGDTETGQLGEPFPIASRGSDASNQRMVTSGSPQSHAMSAPRSLSLCSHTERKSYGRTDRTTWGTESESGNDSAPARKMVSCSLNSSRDTDANARHNDMDGTNANDGTAARQADGDREKCADVISSDRSSSTSANAAGQPTANGSTTKFVEKSSVDATASLASDRNGDRMTVRRQDEATGTDCAARSSCATRPRKYVSDDARAARPRDDGGAVTAVLEDSASIRTCPKARSVCNPDHDQAVWPGSPGIRDSDSSKEGRLVAADDAEGSEGTVSGDRFTDIRAGMAEKEATSNTGSAGKGAIGVLFKRDESSKDAVEAAKAALAAVPTAAKAAAKAEALSAPHAPGSTTAWTAGRSQESQSSKNDCCVEVVIGPDGEPRYSLKPGVPRRGKWTPLEEEYAKRIIRDFDAGLLPLQEGAGLRQLLATKLQCEVMRVSKKFCGWACVGKRTFQPLPEDPTGRARKAQASLFALEQKWLKTFVRDEKLPTSVRGAPVPQMQHTAPAPTSVEDGPSLIRKNDGREPSQAWLLHANESLARKAPLKVMDTLMMEGRQYCNNARVPHQHGGTADEGQFDPGGFHADTNQMSSPLRRAMDSVGHRPKGHQEYPSRHGASIPTCWDRSKGRLYPIQSPDVAGMWRDEKVQRSDAPVGDGQSDKWMMPNKDGPESPNRRSWSRTEHRNGLQKLWAVGKQHADVRDFTSWNQLRDGDGHGKSAVEHETGRWRSNSDADAAHAGEKSEDLSRTLYPIYPGSKSTTRSPFLHTPDGRRGSDGDMRRLAPHRNYGEVVEGPPLWGRHREAQFVAGFDKYAQETRSPHGYRPRALTHDGRRTGRDGRYEIPFYRSRANYDGEAGRDGYGSGDGDYDGDGNARRNTKGGISGTFRLKRAAPLPAHLRVETDSNSFFPGDVSGASSAAGHAVKSSQSENRDLSRDCFSVRDHNSMWMDRRSVSDATPYPKMRRLSEPSIHLDDFHRERRRVLDHRWPEHLTGGLDTSGDAVMDRPPGSLRQVSRSAVRRASLTDNEEGPITSLRPQRVTLWELPRSD